MEIFFEIMVRSQKNGLKKIAVKEKSIFNDLLYFEVNKKVRLIIHKMICKKYLCQK